REGLTAILLREAEEATVPGPSAVETLDDQRFRCAELHNLGGIHRKAKRTEQLKAVVFVLDAVREVDSVGEPADGGLEKVRCRSGSERLAPAPLMAKQRGFFLRAGDGDPEIL